MQRLKKEGYSQQEIRKYIDEVQNRKISKFHNRHKVGVALENLNHKMLQSPARPESSDVKCQPRSIDGNFYSQNKI